MPDGVERNETRENGNFCPERKWVLVCICMLCDTASRSCDRGLALRLQRRGEARIEWKQDRRKETIKILWAALFVESNVLHLSPRLVVLLFLLA